MVQLAQFLFLGLAALAEAVPIESGSLTRDDAVNYLKQWRPKEDGAPEDFFRANAEFSLKTKDLPYAQQVSKNMFLNYVLPYTHFDEPRDDWRQKMYETLLPFVKDKKTLQEAAEALFPAWGNAFGKQLNFRGNMTPQMMAPLTQTLSSGYASCTGMSIFLADCMRSVGIPARVVGVKEWNRADGGNHNWVEIWMGDHWNFVDAVPTGDLVTWNQTWFVEQAKKQTSTPAQFAVMSPLWGPEAHAVYDMSWRTPSTFVPAIDLTSNYAGPLHPPLSDTRAAATYTPTTFLTIFLLTAVVLGGAGYCWKVSKDRSTGYTAMS